MSSAAQSAASGCVVIGGEKLPTDSGGDSICAAVERAIAVRAPETPYKVEVQVLSRSRLAATLIVNGRTLPVQNFAVMDRNLSAISVNHFADSLAAAVAEAAKP